MRVTSDVPTAAPAGLPTQVREKRLSRVRYGSVAARKSRLVLMPGWNGNQCERAREAGQGQRRTGDRVLQAAGECARGTAGAVHRRDRQAAHSGFQIRVDKPRRGKASRARGEEG